MNIIEINKLIKKYDGENTFIISLIKQLKSKYVKRVDINGKSVPSLSESQYNVAISILKKEGYMTID